MAEIRSNFSEMSEEYDARVRKVIPKYDEMLTVLISCIAPQDGHRMRAIDLGCGTGAVSKRLLDKFPKTELTCLDMTERMLDLAKQRLSAQGDVRYVLSDFDHFEFDGPYDVIISSLALHHILTDQDKKRMYHKIFDALLPRGSFYNADLVQGSNDHLQDLYMNQWKDHMYKSFSRKEVDDVLIPRYEHEDSPVKLINHLRWLDEVGYRGVDIIWKYYNFAVYGGRK
jgi:tRNA (cmo5U34)-methyltransferase